MFWFLGNEIKFLYVVCSYLKSFVWILKMREDCVFSRLYNKTQFLHFIPWISWIDIMNAYHGCISDFLKRKSEAFDPAPCNKAAFFYFIHFPNGEKNWKAKSDSPNVSKTPITAIERWQCLLLKLRGKHCRKQHCLDGVVDTLGLS